MKVVISPKRVFHAVLMANELAAAGHETLIYSGATGKFFRRLNARTQLRLAPLPLAQLASALRLPQGGRGDAIDSVVLDQYVARRLGSAKPDVLVGLAGSSLAGGRRAKRGGASFVLDRACPSVRFQQDLLARECERHGFTRRLQPDWFVARQEAEYDEADMILCPSRYSADSFPPALSDKIVVAPLLGRAVTLKPRHRRDDGRFVVGSVGGDVIRKGYVYLLKAWRRLGIPGAKLRIRSGALRHEPVLAPLLDDTVEIVDYVQDIADFYAGCDAFILPSIDDGFGMAAFEAMACGVPTVLTRRCGAAELVDHGTTAHLIDAFCEDAIIAALQRLATDCDYREALGQAGQALVGQLAGTPGQSIYGKALIEALSTLPRRPDA